MDYGWVVGPLMILTALYGVYRWICAAEKNWAATTWPCCRRCGHPLTMLVRPAHRTEYRCLACPRTGGGK